jgi:hypothetical protein
MRTTLYLAMAAAALGGCLSSAYDAGGGGSGGAGGTAGGGGGSSGGGGSGTSSGSVTYYRDVLPIFQKDCLSCHATGGAAQPVLDQAQSAIAAASTIEAAIQSKMMPPFPPAEGCNAYVGERRMTAVDQQVVAQWAAGGAPAGDPATAPAATSGGGIQLGAPDKHLSAAAPFTPTYPGSAGANDLYWCFVLDPQLGAASDLTAMNIVPGQKNEVHHVIVFRDPGGQGSAGKPAGGYECNGAPGEMLTGWVPGSGPLQLPAGVGMTISPGDKLLMQVHYHKDPAVPTTADATAVDLYFSPTTMPEHAYVVWAGTPLFTIPANAKGYAVNSTCTVNGSWKLLGVAPHMHQHATKFASNIQAASGNACLMNIPHWDFGWQGGYFLQQPVQLAAGDKVTTTCTYDNDTASQIKFGEATTDEMCFGFLYVVAASKPTFSGLVNVFGGQNAASMCAN